MPRPVRGALISETALSLRLYPPAKKPAGAEVFPRLVSVDLGGSYAVAEVVMLTDWWQKRPKRIVAFDQDGRLLGSADFDTYTDMVCGENGDEKCEVPARPTAQLRVPCSGATASRVTIFVNGLLSEPNEFAVLEAVRVYAAA